jgi:hypothetical protein
MRRRFVECALQADEVAGKHEIDDLAPPIVEAAMTHHDAFGQREKLLDLCALLDQHLAFDEFDFPGLEILHIRDLIIFELAQSRLPLKRTAGTRHRSHDVFHRNRTLPHLLQCDIPKERDVCQIAAQH